MNNINLLSLFVSMFAMNLPTLIVCLVAGVVILTRWKQSPSGSLWALLGFGLALILCFVMPLAQAFVQQWVMQSGEVARRASVFASLSILWSVLRAATYALLLVAAFAGRTAPNATTHRP